MANRVVAERHVIAISNNRVVSLIHRERDEVIRFALQGSSRGIRNRGDHALQIGGRNSNLTRNRVTDSVWRLRDGSSADHLGRGARDGWCSLRHPSILSHFRKSARNEQGQPQSRAAKAYVARKRSGESALE
jgi:hypothetical protein